MREGNDIPTLLSLIRAGRLPKECQNPPDEFAEIWDAFCELSDTRDYVVLGNDAQSKRLSYLEIEAYARLKRIPDTVEFSELVVHLDRIYLKEWNQWQEKRRQQEHRNTQ